MNRCDRRPQLQAARLYVLTDGATSASDFVTRVQRLVESQVDIIQLRDKSLDDRTLLARAKLLVQQVANHPTLAIINDRTDIALSSLADGVHLGQDDLGIDDVRHLVPAHFLIGVSTHSAAQAAAAERAGADYIGVGPTYPSTTKSFSHFTGESLLREVARTIQIPAFAIGGISLDRLPQVLGTGIRRVAVAQAICGADDPAAVIRQFRAHFESAPGLPEVFPGVGHEGN